MFQKTWRFRNKFSALELILQYTINYFNGKVRHVYAL